MLREQNTIRQTTKDLISVSNELDLVEFLRKHFSLEYDEIFNKELEEQINLSKSLYYANYSDYDIRRYTLFCLKQKLKRDFHINIYYTFNRFRSLYIWPEFFAGRDLFWKPMMQCSPRKRIRKRLTSSSSKKLRTFVTTVVLFCELSNFIQMNFIDLMCLNLRDKLNVATIG